MISKNVNQYSIAEISSEDNRSITELEELLSSRANKGIVLVAYETKITGEAEV